MGLGGVGGAMTAQPHQEKFDSAIEFLERVKVVYADQPAVYNQFLDIMKVRSPRSSHPFLPFTSSPSAPMPLPTLVTLAPPYNQDLVFTSPHANLVHDPTSHSPRIPGTHKHT